MIILPPQPGEVWYVKLHEDRCSSELDTVEVLEFTDQTVLLRVRETDSFRPHTSRYLKSTVAWVERVPTVASVNGPATVTQLRRMSP